MTLNGQPITAPPIQAGTTTTLSLPFLGGVAAIPDYASATTAIIEFDLKGVPVMWAATIVASGPDLLLQYTTTPTDLVVGTALMQGKITTPTRNYPGYQYVMPILGNLPGI